MNQLERLHTGAFYNLHKRTVSYSLSLKKRDRQTEYECVCKRKTKKNGTDQWFSNSLLLESPYTLKIYYWEAQSFFFNLCGLYLSLFITLEIKTEMFKILIQSNNKPVTYQHKIFMKKYYKKLLRKVALHYIFDNLINIWFNRKY